jgi:hypothetical protein
MYTENSLLISVFFCFSDRDSAVTFSFLLQKKYLIQRTGYLGPVPVLISLIYLQFCVAKRKLALFTLFWIRDILIMIQSGSVK